jgi:hypothetical protein
MSAINFEQYQCNPFAMLGGVRVVKSLLAETVTVRHKVVRHPILKRRRNWRVVRIEEHKPAAYMIGGHTLVIHPLLMCELKELKP